MTEMAVQWARMEGELQSSMDALALQIRAMRDAGEVVNPGKLYRMERYSRLLFEIRRETETYADYAARTVTAGQEQAAWLGQQEAVHTLRVAAQAQGAQAAVGAAFTRLAPSAVEGMVGMMADGSPLRQYLEGVYGDAARGMSKYLVRAVTQGLNPRETARQMRKGLGLGLDRSLTIARTEQLRVYRESQRLTWEASGVVQGYQRIAAKQKRACLGCLLADGQVYPLSVPFEDHVNGRCAAVPILLGDDARQWETGSTWLQAQPEATQRDIMGAGRYNLYKSGEVPLEQMKQHTYDPVWGGSWGPTPVKDLVGSAAAQEATG